MMLQHPDQHGSSPLYFTDREAATPTITQTTPITDLVPTNTTLIGTTEEILDLPIDLEPTQETNGLLTSLQAAAQDITIDNHPTEHRKKYEELDHKQLIYHIVEPAKDATL